MKHVKLSIIIPCYNSFNMMSKALSVFSKNSKESFEVIVVDDCSTDGSYESLCEYAKKTNYSIRILRTEENSGPGIARNKGIYAAIGEYITFLDSDDYFTDDYFLVLMPELNGDNDCLIYDFYMAKGNKQKKCSSFFCEEKAGFVDTEKTTALIRGVAWGKIFKKCIAVSNNICFLPQKRHEDIAFTKCMISFSKVIKYIKQPLYCYQLQQLSLTHNSLIDAADNPWYAYEYIHKHINSEMYESKIPIFIVEYLIPVALINTRNHNKNEWKDYMNNQERKFGNINDNEYLKMYTGLKRLEIKLVQRKAYYLIKIYTSIKNNFR